MIDTLFQDERNCDWGMALLGYSGLPGSAERLSEQSIRNFANAELERTGLDDAFLQVVVDLATNSALSAADLRERLAMLCDAMHVDIDRSRLKWQYALLRDLIANPEDDPVYGMIALTEFWNAWGWPDDRPDSMKNDDITPGRYHSAAYYDYVLNDHRSWLARNEAASHLTPHSQP